MKKIAIVLLLVGAACHRKVSVGSPQPQQPAPAVPGVPGAATTREAVDRFMSAVKVGDLDALSLIWGSAAGPARATMSRETWEMREVVMMRCLKHESYSVQAEMAAAGGERVSVVAIRFRDLTPTTNFTTTRDSSGRWFVEAVDMKPLEQVCARKA